MVYYEVLRTIRDAHLAEDVVQDTFCRVLCHRYWFHTIDEQHQVNYLMKISRNLCVDYKRKGCNLTFVPYDDDFWNEKVSPAEPCGEFFDKEMILYYTSMLKGVEKEVIHLKYYHGYSIAQIAKMKKAPENTIVKRLSRGHKNLRERLENG